MNCNRNKVMEKINKKELKQLFNKIRENKEIYLYLKYNSYLYKRILRNEISLKELDTLKRNEFKQTTSDFSIDEILELLEEEERKSLKRTYVDVTDNGDGTKTVALKADAYDKLKIENVAVTTIDYTGDINTDGKVNIADANAVYQMVLSGGAYYSEEQLNDYERLKADMSKDNAEAHGSIADVNAIITIINDAANTTTNP